MRTVGLLLGALLSLPLLAGCGSAPAPAPAPPQDPSPETPVVFTLDRSTPLPLLTLRATREEVIRLRSLYASFYVEMGRPDTNATLSLRYDKQGSLGVPWNFYLRNFTSPYTVRLMGIKSGGQKDILHEVIY